MRLLTAVAFVTLCTAVGASAATAEKPQNGQMNNEARKSRIKEALVAKNDAALGTEMSARAARKARQSCIVDYQTICKDDASTGIGVALSKSKKLISGSAAKQRAFDALADEDNSDDNKAVSVQNSLRSVRTRGLIGGGGKRRFALKGMESCLAKHLDEIQNPKCKDFISGRITCFSEAETVCASSIGQKLDGSGSDSSKSQKDSNNNKDKKTKEQHKKKTASQAIVLDGAGAAAALAVKDASKDNVRIPVGLKGEALDDFLRERAKMSCLRDSDQSLFSSQCVSSTYYSSLAAHKAAKQQQENGKKKGLLGRIKKA